jgi:hypothetical protein
VGGEPSNLLDIHALRVQSQVADLHVIDHATAKRDHRQLLCETNSATWRRGIVPQRSPQNSKQQSVIVTRPTLSIVGKEAVCSPRMGNAQRLPNGNTLITESSFGRIFEVTKNGKIVSEYVNPSLVRRFLAAHQPLRATRSSARSVIAQTR